MTRNSPKLRPHGMSILNSAKSALAGVTGAVALTLIHQAAKQTTPNAPRADILGMRTLARSFRALGTEPPNALYELTLAGDLVSNGIYYGFAGAFGAKNAVVTGTVLGILAGVGSVVIPPKLGLGGPETNRTTETQALTIGMYTVGGLVAGVVYRLLGDSSDE